MLNKKNETRRKKKYFSENIGRTHSSSKIIKSTRWQKRDRKKANKFSLVILREMSSFNITSPGNMTKDGQK